MLICAGVSAATSCSVAFKRDFRSVLRDSSEANWLPVSVKLTGLEVASIAFAKSKLFADSAVESTQGAGWLGQGERSQTQRECDELAALHESAIVIESVHCV